MLGKSVANLRFNVRVIGPTDAYNIAGGDAWIGKGRVLVVRHQ